MLDATLKFAHLLAVIVWVGGMVFSHAFLRPALGVLEPAQRFRLMHAVLQRFLGAVVVAVVVAVFSGFWMIGRVAKVSVQAGVGFAMPLDWTIMGALGVLMALIFAVIRWRLFPRLARAVAACDWPAAGAALATVRAWIGVNLGLGLLTVAVALLLN